MSCAVLLSPAPPAAAKSRAELYCAGSRQACRSAAEIPPPPIVSRREMAEFASVLPHSILSGERCRPNTSSGSREEGEEVVLRKRDRGICSSTRTCKVILLTTARSSGHRTSKTDRQPSSVCRRPAPRLLLCALERAHLLNMTSESDRYVIANTNQRDRLAHPTVLRRRSHQTFHDLFAIFDDNQRNLG